MQLPIPKEKFKKILIFPYLLKNLLYSLFIKKSTGTFFVEYDLLSYEW